MILCKSRQRTYAFAMVIACLFTWTNGSHAQQITVNDEPARLDIRIAGKLSVRITLMPVSAQREVPVSPVVENSDLSKPVLSLSELNEPIEAKVGSLSITVKPSPLAVLVKRPDGSLVQEVSFLDDGNVSFAISDQPILGLGEGGPQPPLRGDWRQQAIQFDRNDSLHQMIPRWESNAYGSRNPVAMMIGTEGWGLFVSTPWGEVDLRDKRRGVFQPWQPPSEAETEPRDRRRAQDRERALQGRPPIDSIIRGAFDVFVFDARDPTIMMDDLSRITGRAVMPPKWALGYMQSHRELVDSELTSEALLVWVVDTFRAKGLPIDAVIYLGTGFTPTGWNKRQPSFEFNPLVFEREPSEVIDDLHERNVKVVVHMVPWEADRLPTLHGDIPALQGQTLDASHIQNYWSEHTDLVQDGIDAWWPDEGDRFNLFERIKRHQLYYEGPLSTQPNKRPWSLHRNGHLGVARWGGWVWSGDTQSAWKTLEGQIAVGVNHSLSLSPYWGSDTGGFYAGIDPPELSGELYARWFQFSAFCPSFRSHGRIWRLRTPFGWGLSEMGSTEGQRFPPDESELNNAAIEPVCRTYAELRYQLIPYTYTLAAEAREHGMPLMRALWLHYPEDVEARSVANQYLWGRDLLVAPVYEEGATKRDVYLPAGEWYDFWNNEAVDGGQFVSCPVDLSKMPIYVRAGAIIPFDPIRQYMAQPVDEPTTIRVYEGANGTFRWYEDDGSSQEYLDGQFAWTQLDWDDDAKEFSMHQDLTSGQLELSSREFVIELLPDGARKTITYDGELTKVRFD